MAVHGGVMRQRTAATRWGWMVMAVIGLGAGTIALRGQTMTTPKTVGTAIKAEPRFSALVAPDAKLEVVADGYDWSEGPVWVPRDGGFLLWSDVPANTIYKWAPGQTAAAFMNASGVTGVGEYSVGHG